MIPGNYSLSGIYHRIARTYRNDPWSRHNHRRVPGSMFPGPCGCNSLQPSIITPPLFHESRISEDWDFREIILIAIINRSITDTHYQRADPVILFLSPALLTDRTP